MTENIRPQQGTATVLGNTIVSNKVYVAEFEADAAVPFTFIPGQYCSFIISSSVRRTFSVATSPSVAPKFAICADITPMGPGSQWLMQLKKGDTVKFLGPLGKFVLDQQSQRKRVLVATGTGISPIRSMVLHSLEYQPKLPVSLYWGLRFEDDIFWHEEFSELAKRHSNFIYNLTLSRPKDDWKGLRGRVTEQLMQKEQDMSASDFYLCGNKAMIVDIQAHLRGKNIPEEHIKTELFY